MGWGTSVKADIHFSREYFENIEEVEDKIEMWKNSIERQKEFLLLLPSGKAIIPTDYEDSPIEYYRTIVRDCIDSIIEAEDNLFKLEILKDNFDKTSKY